MCQCRHASCGSCPFNSLAAAGARTSRQIRAGSSPSASSMKAPRRKAALVSSRLPLATQRTTSLPAGRGLRLGLGMWLDWCRIGFSSDGENILASYLRTTDVYFFLFWNRTACYSLLDQLECLLLDQLECYRSFSSPSERELGCAVQVGKLMKFTGRKENQSVAVMILQLYFVDTSAGTINEFILPELLTIILCSAFANVTTEDAFIGPKSSQNAM